MLFGAMQMMAKELTGMKPVEVERYEYGYGEGPTGIKDLLHSPMTLSQGAAIMNEIRARKEVEVENGSVHNGIEEERHADHGGRVQRYDEPVMQ